VTTGWSFQPSGLWDGWNDPSIANFKGKILESLTRETIQNSLDAAISEDEPVYIELTENSFSLSDIPNVEQIKSKLDKCWGFVEHESENSRAEMLAAREALSKKKILVLSIADYGTTGMPGPCELGKPFFSYLKARGQSGGATSRGGSHGIGKAAPLCASTLRTIFVSTMWEDEDTSVEKTLIQGRTTLMSHKEEGVTYSPIGFWGNLGGDDAIDADSCDFDWLKRDEPGTTVHVVGWNRNNTRDWDLHILAWAAVNYFAAFERNRLVLKIGDKELSQENISTVLKNEKLVKLLSLDGHGDRVRDARSFHSCLFEDVTEEETQILHIGHSTVRLRIDEAMPRKIAIIRKNMLVTDRLATFWKQPPARLRDFVGVFECLNKEGEKLIRAMEPPAHDDLSKDNLPLGERDKGHSALNALGNKLKEITSKYAENETEEAGEIDFLKEFFADEAEDGESDQELEDRDPNGDFIATPKPVKLPPPKPVTLQPENDDDAEDEPDVDPNYPGGEGGSGADGGGGGDRGGSGPGVGDGTGGAGEQGVEPRPRPRSDVQLFNSRIVRINENEVRLHATPSSSGEVVVELLEVGADNDEPLDILSSSEGEVEAGILTLSVKKGERFSIQLKANRALVGGIKAVAGTKLQGQST
jgi:hypothetical protein